VYFTPKICFGRKVRKTTLQQIPQSHPNIFETRIPSPASRIFSRASASPNRPNHPFPASEGCIRAGFICSAPVRGWLALPAAKVPGRSDGPCTCGTWRGRGEDQRTKEREREVGGLAGTPHETVAAGVPLVALPHGCQVHGGLDELRIICLL
jgi:hypothetical protein